MRRVVLVAVAAGVLAGGIGAAVQGDDAPAPARSTARAADPAPLRLAGAPREGRLPDGRFDPGRVHYRVRRARVAVRLPDPAGGPDWAVKVFDADRLTIQRPTRTLRGALVVGRNRCAQLGRVEDGRFGWVYGDGRFRRTGILHRTLQCTSRERPERMVDLTTTLRIENPAEPEFATSAVWGLAPRATSGQVEGTGGADGAATVAGGAFLRLGGPDTLNGPDARVVLDGRTLRINPPGVPPRPGGQLRFRRVVPGTERVEARAPDPAGGPGYGVAVARTRDGSTCTGGEGRVVGDRLGGVDLGLGLFFGGQRMTFCIDVKGSRPSLERPCHISSGFGNMQDPESEDFLLRRARIERRLLVGSTTVIAQCHEAVERVTLQTPRDIRTLIPSPLGHAVLAVYDGTFPAGELIFTARLKGGRTWRERFPLGV